MDVLDLEKRISCVESLASSILFQCRQLKSELSKREGTLKHKKVSKEV